MTGQLSSREVSIAGQELVTKKLLEMGAKVEVAPSGSGRNLTVGFPTGEDVGVLVRTNIRPKPAGGSGPPALAWDVPNDVTADVIAFADLSTSRVWLMRREELATIAHQHSRSAHKFVLVTQPGWRSAPHERIRDDQHEELPFERRASTLLGA